MPAAVTIGGAEIQITVTVAKSDVTYAVMEAALLAQGFTDYRISRNPWNNQTDVMITVYALTTPLTGIVIPMVAKDTLNKLATAVGKFGD